MGPRGRHQDRSTGGSIRFTTPGTATAIEKKAWGKPETGMPLGPKKRHGGSIILQ